MKRFGIRLVLLLACSLVASLNPASGAVAASGTVPTVLATVGVGLQPWGVVVDEATNRIFVSNSNSDTVSVIDGATNTVIATIAVAHGPQSLAVDQQKNLVYVSGSPVSVIDATSDTVISTLPNPCGTGSIALDASAGRLYAANLSGTVCIIALATGSLIAQPTYGYFSPSIAINPSTQTLYVSDLVASFLWIVDAQTLGVKAKLGPLLPQEDGVFGLGVNTKTNTAYATNEDGGYVAVVNGATNAVVTTIPIGPTAWNVAVDERTNMAYTAASNKTLYAINGATNSVAYTVPVGSAPIGTAVNTLTGRVYVANSADKTVTVIQTPSTLGITGINTSFEPGQQQPSWTNTVDTGNYPAGGINNVTGICCGLSGPELGIRNEAAHTGNAALMYSGQDMSAASSYAYLKVLDLSTQPLKVGSGTVLSYWIYPQSNHTSPVSVSGNNSTCVAIDLLFSDGKALRDSAAVDQNGHRIHPAQQCGQLTLDAWNHVTSNIGAAVAGKSIVRVDVGYDQPGNTGGYRGYIDDISIQ